MKGFKFLFLFLLIGCASSKVMTDYDAEINFNDLKNYNFYEDVGVDLNELDVKRVMKAINLELYSRGFKETENPDFYINFISKLTEAKNQNTVAIGFGNSGRNGGFGVSGGIPIGGKKLDEGFTIEFVNAKTNQVIWQATLNSTIKEQRKPEQKELHFKEIIKKMLDNYPPKENN